MKSRLDTTLHLLHSASEAALATFSVKLSGYPFASQVPYVLDAWHRPVLLVSALAEHSKNLAANPHASLLVSTTIAEGEIARVSLTGELRSFEPEPGLIARYLRHHPAAERFLQLGDFGFKRFLASQIYVVGGFAQAGWLDGDRLDRLPAIPYDIENDLIETMTAQLDPGTHLLGIDAYGIDVMQNRQRRRLDFSDPPIAEETLAAATAKLVAALRSDQQ